MQFDVHTQAGEHTPNTDTLLCIRQFQCESIKFNTWRISRISPQEAAGWRITASRHSDSPWLQRGEGIICGHSLSGCVKLPSCPQTYFWKEPQLLNRTWSLMCVAGCLCVSYTLKTQEEEDRPSNCRTPWRHKQTADQSSFVALQAKVEH